MRNTEYFREKKVTILGLGRTGFACANLLSSLGAEVSVSDSADNEPVRSFASRLSSSQIKLELGVHTPEFIKGKDFIIVSPGIPDTAPPLVWAKQFRCDVISEIELAWMLCPATIIAVTGTNGKTTVTTLIGKMLGADGRRVFTCGNIGNPFAGEVEKMVSGDFVSLEVSSFQLERIKGFRTKIALILNVSPNHLDRYADMEHYLCAKKGIFRNQGEEDFLLLNSQDPLLAGLAGEARSKVIYFSQSGQMNPNQAAVLSVGSLLGIPRDLIFSVFREFGGIEHRLEHVREIGSVSFINDSKATTVDATLWALKNTPGPIILIAGGREKGNDYSAAIDYVREKVKKIILIGEAKQRIRQVLEGVVPLEEADSLDDAVRGAFALAAPGGTVLFSPMCKSFDMFLNYEERGEAFKKAVNSLSAPDEK